MITYCSYLPLHAQILDDSTQQIYGPKTTEFFLEKQVLENSDKKAIVDTTLDTFHQFTIPNKTNYYYQNLGSPATALRPVFYQPPKEIGTLLGMNPYHLANFSPENVRYFDTRSPFTQVNYVQGGNGEQYIKFRFARSVNDRMNLGFNYTRFNTNFLFGGDSNEILSDLIKGYAHFSFTSKNTRYRVLYHYVHLNQMVEETGGVRLDTTLENNGLFSFRDAESILQSSTAEGVSARTRQTHNNHHIYQQFRLDTALTLFHILDLKRQKDAYQDDELQNHFDFYPGQSQRFTEQDGVSTFLFNFNNEQTSEGSLYRLFQNQVGIKGTFSGFNYIAYFKNRIYNWTLNVQGDTLFRTRVTDGLVSQESITGFDTRIDEIENFVGGKLFYRFSDSTRLTAEAEFKLGRDYRIEGVFVNKSLRLGLLSMLHAPTLIQRRFLSNHFEWDRLYSNTLVNKIYGSITLSTPRLLFQPFGSYTLLTNYIYFDELATPQQSRDALQQLQIGLDFKYRLGRFHTANQVTYTEILGSNLIRVPNVLINSRLYCEDCLLRRFIASQVGVEMYFRTDYFGNSYMPTSKQFFLQNDQRLRTYPVVDLYANFKIQNFRIFLKLTHINELPNDGYQATPLYPGTPRTFVFGIDWMFFN